MKKIIVTAFLLLFAAIRTVWWDFWQGATDPPERAGTKYFPLSCL